MSGPDTPSRYYTFSVGIHSILWGTPEDVYSLDDLYAYDAMDFVAAHLDAEDMVSLRRAACLSSSDYGITAQEHKLRMCLEVVAEYGWGFYIHDFKTKSLTERCQEGELPTDKLTKALHITRAEKEKKKLWHLASFSCKHRTYMPIMSFVKRIYEELGGWEGHVRRGKDAARRQRRREADRARKMRRLA